MVALITSLKEFGCQFPYFYLHFKHFFNVQAEVGDFFSQLLFFQGQE